MEEKKNILTYEGLRKYEDELHNLKVVKRQEVAQKQKSTSGGVTPDFSQKFLRNGLEETRR